MTRWRSNRVTSTTDDSVLRKLAVLRQRERGGESRLIAQPSEERVRHRAWVGERRASSYLLSLVPTRRREKVAFTAESSALTKGPLWLCLAL